MTQVVSLRVQGHTVGWIAKHLTTQGVPTTRGGEWRASSVRRLIRGQQLDRQSLDALALREKESA